MTILSIHRDVWDMMDESEVMVCVFCDQDTTLPYCALCHEYKGLMTVAEWESYTGETWE
jgi:hypothetical protein